MSEQPVDHVQEFARYLGQEKHLALMLRNRVKRWGNRVACRHKPEKEWVSVTWTELGEQIEAAAKALLAWGVQPGEMVAVFSANRIEWTVADFAAHSVRAVPVPVYGTNTARELEYIVNDAGIRVLFAGNREQYAKAKEVASTSRFLRKIVAFDPAAGVEPSDDRMDLAAFLALGRRSNQEAALEERLRQLDPEDLATLIYTSGTTGEPKGVMLTHKAFLAMVFGTGYHQPVGEDDVSLAFLPLSHVFERAWTYLVLSRGAENHYCHDTKRLLEFLRESRPTYMTSVPRIWEKVYGTVMEDIHKAAPAVRTIFDWALGVGGRVESLKRDGRPVPWHLSLLHGLATLIVLRKIRNVFGGRCKMFNVGGAAFSGEIAEFFFKAGILLLQGYGLTECFVICVASPSRNKFGTCGTVVPLVELRVSEEGELQSRGPNMMKGYYNKPELTRDSFTPDGWIKTGDVGQVDAEGFVTVTDRIKELIKTSGGKYVAPQHLENLLKEDIYVEQAVVVGEGRNYVCALIVPAFTRLERYAAEHGIACSSREELIARPEVLELFRARIDHQTRDVGQVQKIKKFRLMPHEFTQEQGEVTATQKIRRKIINQKYAAVIDALYAE